MILVLALCYYIASSDRDEAIEEESFRRRIDARYRRTEERKQTRYADREDDLHDYRRGYERDGYEYDNNYRREDAGDNYEYENDFKDEV